MEKLYCPDTELDLAFVKSLLEAEGIPYFVHNEHFGSLEIGPQIDLFNARTIYVEETDLRRGRALIAAFLEEDADDEGERAGKRAYTWVEKMRVSLETVLFFWFVPPGRKARRGGRESARASSCTNQPGRWQVFLLVAVGIFMATLDGSIVNIAVPTIMEELGVSVAAVQWVVMIYLLTVTSLLLSFGRLSDIHGRRLVYSLGLGLFSVGSLFCGLAPTIGWLIISRLFQGLGAAMIMACTPALIVDAFPPAERGRALGFVGSVVASGLTAGPVIGGLLLHFFSWRAIFLVNIPIGLVTAVIVFCLLKGSQADITRRERFDWPGAVLIALCLGPLLLVVTHGYEWGMSSRPILLLGALCLASAGCLVLVERRTVHPVLDSDLFRIRLFSIPILAAVMIFASLFSLVFLMPFYLVNPGGFGVDRAGYLMATIFVFLFVLSPLSGTLSDRIGSRFLCTAGLAFIAASLYLLALLPAGAGVVDIVWRLALAGIGMALFIPPNSATAMSSVPPHRRGVASATVAAARNLGMVLGVAVSGAVFNSTFHRLSHGGQLKVYQPVQEPLFMQSFHTAMITGMLIALAGVVVSYLRGPEPKQSRSEG